MGAIYGVMQFYNILRAGISWKGPEAIELWYEKTGSGDFCDDNEDATLLSYDSVGHSLWFTSVHHQVYKCFRLYFFKNSAKAVKT
jgi:hypothetical protein